MLFFLTEVTHNYVSAGAFLIVFSWSAFYNARSVTHSKR